MRRKKDPAAEFVAWCETAPIEAVDTVLSVCQWAVSRRKGEKSDKPKPRVVKRNEPPAAANG